MTEPEPRDWYAEADAYEQRLSLGRRIGVMVVVTALALPAVRVLERGQADGDGVASEAPAATVAVTASAADDASLPTSLTTIESAPSEATEPASTASPSDRGTAVDGAGLPEIKTAADVARATGAPVPEPSVDDLPEITAPPSSAAAQASPESSSDPPDDGSGGSGAGGGDGSGAGDQDDSASTPATTSAAQSDDDDDGDAGDEDEPDPTTTTTAAPAPSTTAEADEDDVSSTTTAATPSYSAEQVQQLIRDAWPDGSDEEMALTVAQRESGYRADAVSPTGCCLGIFQIHYEANEKFINSLGFDRDDLFDAAKNIQVAYAMFQRSGWGPWSQTAH